jgi:hypothetical protein
VRLVPTDGSPRHIGTDEPAFVVFRAAFTADETRMFLFGDERDITVVELPSSVVVDVIPARLDKVRGAAVHPQGPVPCRRQASRWVARPVAGNPRVRAARPVAGDPGGAGGRSRGDQPTPDRLVRGRARLAVGRAVAPRSATPGLRMPGRLCVFPVGRSAGEATAPCGPVAAGGAPLP